MIGNLRERVTLLSPVRLPDTGGGADIQYQTRDTIWAQTQLQGSAIDNEGGRRAGLARRQFTLRHREDLIFEMRLKHRGKTYRITDIQEDDDKKRFHFITGEEVRPS